ncbi:MAG: hypothetical protein JNJ46_33540 [Myxococcales bacterium]|nr:hypothetical protein [Myxococcales bacterium]
MPGPDLTQAPLIAPSDLFGSSALPPRAAGIYAWYFDAPPPHVPIADCLQRGPFTLLYIGIAPKQPSSFGAVSRATLRSRLRQHCVGTVEGSTLRLTLGCLLADTLGLRLAALGRSGRLTFGADGEARLSAWMAVHARVSFVITPEPWEIERQLLSATSLPLNLRDNDGHPFRSTLGAIRSAARARARAEWQHSSAAREDAAP